MGYESQAIGEKSIAIGSKNISLGLESSAVGEKNITVGEETSAFGSENIAVEKESSAFGRKNAASGKETSAFGLKNNVLADYSSAFGRDNKVSGSYNTVIGGGNVVEDETENNFVLGRYIRVGSGIENSVVLGYNSTVKDSNVVSVGSEKLQRKIVNVAAGEISKTSTDAVNGSQLSDIASNYFHVNTGDDDQPSGNADTNFAMNGEKGGARGEHSLAAGINAYAGNKKKIMFSNLDEDWKNYQSKLYVELDGKERKLSDLSPEEIKKLGGDYQIKNLAYFKSTTDYRQSDQMAIGKDSRAIKDYALALGNRNMALGDYSMAIGQKNIAFDTYSLALGAKNISSKQESNAVGFSNETSSNRSSAFGVHNKAGHQKRTKYSDLQLPFYRERYKGLLNIEIDGRNKKLSELTEEEYANLSNDEIKKNAYFVHTNDTATEQVAIGSRNIALAGESLAAGYKNISLGRGSSAIGYENGSSGYCSLAIGSMNISAGGNSSAIGYENITEGEYATALGHKNYAGKKDKVMYSDVYGDYSHGYTEEFKDLLYINMADKERKLSDLSEEEFKALSKDDLKFKTYFKTNASMYQTAIGNESQAVGGNSVAIGCKSLALDSAGLAIGFKNIAADGWNNTAIGYKNIASNQGSSAVGHENKASAASSSAFGSDNTSTGGNSSAFGYNNTVSGRESAAFGHTNVVSGETSTALGHSNNVGGSYNTAIGRGNTIKDKASEVFVFGSNIVVESGIKHSVALGYNSTLTDSNVISVGSDKIQRRIVNVAAGTNDTDAVNLGQLKNNYYDKQYIDGLKTEFEKKLTNKEKSFATRGMLRSVASIEDENISMNGGKIINVEEGDISEGSTDAVTGGQVYEIKEELEERLSTIDESVENIGEGISQNAKNIEKLGGRVKKVGALSAALAGLHPMQYDPMHPNQVMAAMGSYKDSQAVAVGMTHYFNENLMASGGISLGTESNNKDLMANIGFTWKIGRDSKENLAVPSRYDGKQMASIYMMQTEIDKLIFEKKQDKEAIRNQQEENRVLKSKVHELEARLNKLEKLLTK